MILAFRKKTDFSSPSNICLVVRSRTESGKVYPLILLFKSLELSQRCLVVPTRMVSFTDIKPSNIMFRYDGLPVLTDFGVARTVGAKTVYTASGLDCW